MWHIPLHWWARMSSARSKLDVEEPYTLKRRIISATQNLFCFHPSQTHHIYFEVKVQTVT
jgi:hypothetical protein